MVAWIHIWTLYCIYLLGFKPNVVWTIFLYISCLASEYYFTQDFNTWIHHKNLVLKIRMKNAKGKMGNVTVSWTYRIFLQSFDQNNLAWFFFFLISLKLLTIVDLRTETVLCKLSVGLQKHTVRFFLVQQIWYVCTTRRCSPSSVYKPFLCVGFYYLVIFIFHTQNLCHLLKAQQILDWCIKYSQLPQPATRWLLFPTF